ncbi:discoidin domain-containing protein [Verrucosispora sp. NA02020]|uniref:discoidin domain-containing protein n=1 Tax=Verrucosispora sp. NA02020 TaxID=2742132 RepID=UPI00158FCD2B|nr:discoidin domain-containing protein [Verrucosispora sp. NA02020]QKW11519.1 discoidin domain-containing protein [Verrucosispora sp. NA02020]QKW11643.1 discoidin domain-containing protein [Verrucosispora sp. NA02020]
MADHTVSHHPHPPGHRLRTTLAALTGTALAAASISVVTLAGTATPARAAGLSPFDIVGRGATVAFVELEAEYAAHTGTRIGPDRRYGTLPSEASGREAVTLDAVGEYVEFTLTAPANAVTFRYSLPDNAAGTGRDATIDLRANGSLVKPVPVTSKYGWYYGGYPFNNNPGDVNPHHFYDEARTLFGTTYPTGTKIRLQVSSTAQSPTFTIDLADFELVAAPITKPANVLDVVTDFGADPTGATDSTARFQAAVDAGKAQGRTVWIPPGTFTLWDHVVVDGVTLRGAGPWHSVLGGRHPTDRKRAAGVYGKYVSGGGYRGEIRPHEAGGPSRNVELRDFAIIGDIRERVDDDQVNAIGGAMSDSVVDNLWLQHTKVGAWMDGPMDNFTLRNSRILDQTADGVNFHWGVTNSTVTNTFVRNTGDDALAMWADTVPNVGNSFTRNTIGVTVLANHLVTYGGRDIRITDNVTADSVTNGGGIHVANRYTGVQGATAVAGTITVARNTLIRNGNSDYNWRFGVGAIWFSALNEPLQGASIQVSDTDILDSSYAALHWIEGVSSGISFTNVRIDGTGTYALQVQAPSQVSFTNVRATGIAQPNPIHNCVGSGFQISQGAGNSGWYTANPYCGPWPEPQWGGGPTSPPPTTPPPTTPPPTTPPPTTPPPTTPPPGGNLAQGRPVVASSHNQTYQAGNAVDGNAGTYWESGGTAFPQTLTVDLGAARAVDRVVLRLPAGWERRTQALSVSGSIDGSSWTTLAASAGRVFDPATGNNVSIGLPSGDRRFVRLSITGNTGWPAAQIAEFEVYGGSTPPPTTPPPTTAPPTGNLAQGRPVVATSHVDVYAAGNAVDGNAGTYWESANNAFPQTLTVDLGTARPVGRVVLRLPPSPAWQTRTQTVSVLGSTDGTTWTTLAASAGRTFDPATGNSVSISLTTGDRRFVRLSVTGNTGWPAAQIAEFEVHAT